jgi:hypothetical protein
VIREKRIPVRQRLTFCKEDIWAVNFAYNLRI